MSFPLPRTALVAALVAGTFATLPPPAHAARHWDGQSQSIVTTFPSILPATPSAHGYHGARCAIAEAPPGASRSLGCRDRDDVLFQAVEFPDDQTLIDFLESRVLGPANHVEIEDGTTTNLREGRCPEAACFVITFDAADRSRFLFIVAKTGSTFGQLVQLWWPNADFTAVRAS